MANYTSNHSGQQVDAAVEKVIELVNSSAEINGVVGIGVELGYDDIALITTEAISGTTYKVLWKVKPTTSNNVYGYAVHPTTGKLTIIHSINNIKTAEQFLMSEDKISLAEIDNLFN